jgi:hypothetical protein
MSWRECPDPSLEDIIFVDRLPSDAWPEGIVLRPSGQALATRIDGAELYNLVSLTETMEFGVKQEPPRVAHTFPGANTVFSICPLSGGPPDLEEYAVVTCHASYDPPEMKDVIVWRISYTKEAAADYDGVPSVSKIADVPNGGFCLGLDPISDDVLLIGDASTPCIRRVRISTGETDVLLQHPSMKPQTEQEMWGMNRVRYAGGYIWYTNTSTGVFWRVPVERTEDGLDLRVTGEPEAVAEGMVYADGLVMSCSADRSKATAYAANWVEGMLWRVDVDMSTGKGEVVTLYDDLVRPTAMYLDQKSGKDKPTLYLLCCGAVAASFLETEHGAALNHLGVSKNLLPIEVLITTEVVVTYETAEGY